MQFHYAPESYTHAQYINISNEPNDFMGLTVRCEIAIKKIIYSTCINIC